MEQSTPPRTATPNPPPAPGTAKRTGPGKGKRLSPAGGTSGARQSGPDGRRLHSEGKEMSPRGLPRGYRTEFNCSFDQERKEPSTLRQGGTEVSYFASSCLKSAREGQRTAIGMSSASPWCWINHLL